MVCAAGVSVGIDRLHPTTEVANDAWLPQRGLSGRREGPHEREHELVVMGDDRTESMTARVGMFGARHGRPKGTGGYARRGSRGVCFRSEATLEKMCDRRKHLN